MTPGPTGIQKFIGPLMYSANPLWALRRTKSTYGDYCKLSDIVREAYLFSDPLAIEEILVKKHQSFQKDFFLKNYFPLLGDGLLTSDGESWKFQRQLTNPAFLNNRIKKYFEVILDETDSFLTSTKVGETRDVHKDMMGLTLNIVVKALFGSSVEKDVEKIQKALDIITKYFHFIQSVSSWMPAANKIPTRLYFKNKKAEDALIQVISRIVEEKTKAPTEDDLLSTLIKSTSEDGKGLSRDLLLDNVVTLFTAGHETTALSLSFTWHLLSQHPKVKEKLISEIKDHFNKDRPQFEEIGQLTYLDAVIKESMRLYPPAWIMGREASEDVQIGGRNIKKGSQVYFSQWLVHRDERWFKDPDQFLPERWLEETKRPKFSYFPFGGGPRICIGMSFALTEAKAILIRILQNHDLVCTNTDPLKLIPSVTLRPGTSIPYRLI